MFVLLFVLSTEMELSRALVTFMVYESVLICGIVLKVRKEGGLICCKLVVVEGDG